MMEMYKLMMQGIVIIVGGYILIAVVRALLNEREKAANPQPSAEAPIVECDCKIYFNKKRGYYYAKARNAEGQLAYVKGSYAKSEEESLALCKRNSSCSA